jgi:hypothetical protein
MSDFKTLVEYLGMDSDKIKTLEDFKKDFEPNFVRINAIHERKDLIEPLINAAYGKRLGLTEVALKRLAKEYSLDWTADELKDKKIEEMAEIFVTKAITNRNNYVEELEKKVKTMGGDAIKEWENKLLKAEQKLKDERELLKKTADDFEAYKTEANNKMKAFQIDYLSKDYQSKLKLKKDITPIEREGFNAILNQKYIKDLDENGELIVRTKDGKRIPNEKVAGTYKSYAQILEEEAVAAKLYELNPNANKRFEFNNNNQNQNNNNNNNNNQRPMRRLHPSLAK